MITLWEIPGLIISGSVIIYGVYKLRKMEEIKRGKGAK
jgi:hypothetical protein